MAPPTLFAAVEGVSEYRFDNGLRLIVVPDPSRSTFTLVSTILSGVADDPAGAQGLGHLIEHVSLNQTTHHPHLSEEIASRGDACEARFGLEWTRYCFELPYTPDNLAWALDVEVDRLEHPLYTEEAVRGQLPIIRQEEELQRNNPSDSMIRLAVGLANHAHPYHRAGVPQNLDRLTPELMMSYHRAHYRPDNALLVLSGPVRADEAAIAVASAYASVTKPGERPYARPTTSQPPQEGERTFVVDRPGSTNVVMLVYRTPPASHPDYGPLAVLTEILKGPGGRALHAVESLAAHETKVAPSLEVASQSGYLWIYGQAGRAWPTNALDAALTRSLRDVAPRITAADVESAKTSLRQRWRQRFADSAELAFDLSTWASAGDWRLSFLVRDAVSAVSRDDVLRVAKTYLRPANCTKGLFVATDAPAPADVEPGDLSSAGSYRGGAAPETGESFGWTLPELEARTQRGVLDGGLRYALTPVRMRAGRAIILLSLHANALREIAAPELGLVAKMMLRGTRTLDRRAFEARLRSLEAAVEVKSVPGGAIFVVDAYGGHVSELVELLHEALTQPRFDPGEVDALRTEELAALRTSGNDAQETARLACLARLYPRADDGRGYVPPRDESLIATRRITRARLTAVHRVFLAGAAGEWGIVGSQDAEETKRTLSRVFGGWRAGPRVPEPVFASRQELDQQVVLPGVRVAAMCAGLRLPPFIGDADYPALQVATLLMASAEAGFTRLGRRIRFTDKLSYSIWGRLDDLPSLPEPTLTISATYDPTKQAEITRAFWDEIEIAGQKGFSASELETAKKLWLGRRRTRLSDPKRLAFMLATQLERGKTFVDEGVLAAQVSQVGSEEVAAAIRRYWTSDAFEIVFVEPQDRPKEMRRGT